MKELFPLDFLMNFVVLIHLELVLLEDKVEVIALQEQLGVMQKIKVILEMDGKNVCGRALQKGGA